MDEQRESCALVAAELAHEIRNVFTIVAGAAELIGEDLPAHSEGRVAMRDVMG